MCSMIKTANTTVCYMGKWLREKIWRVLISRKKYIYFLYFFHVVSIWDDGCSLNLHTAPCQLHLSKTGRKIISFLDTSKSKSVVTQRFGFPKETVIMDDHSCPCLTTSLAWPHRVSTSVGVELRGKQCSNKAPPLKQRCTGWRGEVKASWPQSTYSNLKGEKLESVSNHFIHWTWGFPGGSAGKEFACNVGDLGSVPGLGRSPGGRVWQLSPVFFPGESHGHRSLLGYSPWGCKELTE